MEVHNQNLEAWQIEKEEGATGEELTIAAVEKKWKEAYQEFFSGFSRHSETANPRARECLKYVVLGKKINQ